ncbi:hypothetical protein J6590_011424 [Homalodisca vitripennis]|nr:hypothetical protein J6590_011424 [Homalodisca vitripennis]
MQEYNLILSEGVSMGSRRREYRWVRRDVSINGYDETGLESFVGYEATVEMDAIDGYEGTEEYSLISRIKLSTDEYQEIGEKVGHSPFFCEIEFLVQTDGS